VESLFGIDDGLWAELAAGDHAAASHVMTARDPKRRKRGRIVSGAASGARTGEWLTPGHRRAKTITNCVTNRLCQPGHHQRINDAQQNGRCNGHQKRGYKILFHKSPMPGLLW
jgi:hypothetical protein